MFDDGTFTTVLAQPERSTELLLKELLAEKQFGTYVSIAAGHVAAKQSLTRMGVDVSRIFFVDAQSRKDILHPQRAHVANPKKLGKLHEAINHAHRQGLQNFVLIDSLDELAVHNGELKTEKFIHRLANNLREKDVAGILLARQHSDLAEHAGHLSDQFLHV